jgi:two-component system, LytTR family, sensor kinase
MPPPPELLGGGGAGLVEPGGAGRRESVFLWKQLASDSFSVFLNVFAYAALVGLAQAVHFYRQSNEREGRAAVLEAQLTKARLNSLQAQLHPHFLFNALNAISTLLRRDTRAAQDALTSFSDLLRMALSYSTQPEVLLREDVEFLRRYVEIQQTRLGDRFRYEEAIAPEALDSFVPALLLQPLVENAIRHGIEASPDPGVVRVAAQSEGKRLLVTVEDNGAGLPAKEVQGDSGSGIGLQNLRSRLESLYGARHRLEIVSRPGGGVVIRVEIPLRQAPSTELASVAP